jgi:Putative DNA-binding domain
MLNKPLRLITIDDVISYIDERHTEDTVDYKETKYDFDRGDKSPDASARREHNVHEICKDVSALANGLGGDILIGVPEGSDGKPTGVVGVESTDPDLDKRQMQSIIDSWTDPRIDFAIREIPHCGKYVFIVRVEQSSVSPHAVTTETAGLKGPRGKHPKFYVRKGSQNIEMQIDDLRIAFTMSQSIAERMRDFREKRVAKIHANEASALIRRGGSCILHVMPYAAFRTQHVFPIETLADKGLVHNFCPMMWGVSSQPRYNLEGILNAYRPSSRDDDQPPGLARAYTQLFRNGVVEGVVADLIRPSDFGLEFNYTNCEQSLLFGLKRFIPGLQKLGVNPPVWVFPSVDGVKGSRITFEADPGPTPFDRDRLFLPEFSITDFLVDPLPLLRDSCDVLWNAAGVARSPTFDNNVAFVRSRT